MDHQVGRDELGNYGPSNSHTTVNTSGPYSQRTGSGSSAKYLDHKEHLVQYHTKLLPAGAIKSQSSKVVAERSPSCGAHPRAGKMSAKVALNKSMAVTPILKPNSASKTTLSGANNPLTKDTSARQSVRFEPMMSPEASSILGAEPAHFDIPDHSGLM